MKLELRTVVRKYYLSYYRYTVIEQTQMEVQMPLTLPSVTVCSNIPCYKDCGLPKPPRIRNKERGKVSFAELTGNVNAFNALKSRSVKF